MRGRLIKISPAKAGQAKVTKGDLGKEAGKRVQNEIDGIKQSGKDLFDLATSPEARKEAAETLKNWRGGCKRPSWIWDGNRQGDLERR